ncbi:MAG TPA: Spy/CpxP family protein refolding chaperone [Pyrinomonadaceae bacterium]|nr:Spy/CpxP family protein refolding chaperone [Pyrinomonadaceae bacterium]
MRIHWRNISLAAVAPAILLVAAAVVLSQQPRPARPGGFPGGPPPDGFQGPGPGRRGPGGPGGPREVGPFGPFGRDLNLTDDQKAQLEKIHQSFQQGDQALHEQMRTLMEQQGDPFSGQFNEATFRAAAEARAKIQVEMEVSHARMMSQMFGVLTDAQRAQLAAHRDQMKRQGPPPPPPPPPPADQPF